jgi:proteasome beta subunit
MTLILAIPASDGIVMASDGQVTAGLVRWPEKKIKRLNESCLWAASGELALIQRIEESLAGRSNEEPLQNLRDHLADLIKESVTSLLRLDFRTQFCQGNPDTMLHLHPANFVFAEYRDTPRILHITVNGTPEWINVPLASGVGAPFAYALLQKYQGVSLDISKASLLAFKVIEEAIEVVAQGLGPPIDIWQITKQGTKNCSEAEIAALQDASCALREAEVHLFLRPGAPDESRC